MSFWNRFKKAVSNNVKQIKKAAADTGKLIEKTTASLNTAFMVTIAGKRVAFLGQAAVGKTRLKEYYVTSKLPSTTYEATHVEPGTKAMHKSDSEDYFVKAVDDVGGASHIRDANWLAIVAKVDVVCYLARADYLFCDDTNEEAELHKARFSEDIDLIKEWLDQRVNEGGSKTHFVFVFTYCDQLPENEAKLMRDNPTKFGETLYNLDFVKQRRETIEPLVVKCGFSYGSTMTLIEIKKLLKMTAIAGEFIKQKAKKN